MAEKYRFLINLRSDTMNENFIKAVIPSGYLASHEAITKSIFEKKEEALKGIDFFADNGNFKLISSIKKEFAARSQILFNQIRENEKVLGKKITQGKIDSSLQEKIDLLLEEISAECLKRLSGDEVTLEKQLVCKPTHLIGCEDIRMAGYLSLNLEPEYLSLDRDIYRSYNAEVAKRALKIIGQINPDIASNYYAVASAVSYDTAFDAGEVFAKAGLTKAAIGVGAYMSDDNYSDSICINGTYFDLPYTMPNRYLRTALVVRGFSDGYREHSGKYPKAFHFLGLGAPIMMAICSFGLIGTKEVSFDATSPIQDAAEGTLYVNKPALLKIRTKKAALRLCSDKDAVWDCPCPFCNEFVKKYPFNYVTGYNAWKSSGKEEVEIEDLQPGGILYDAYPLLSEPAAGKQRTELNYARMGHNHWSLSEVVKELNTNSTGKRLLKEHIKKIVSDYSQNTNSDLFANSIKFAYDILTAQNITEIIKNYINSN